MMDYPKKVEEQLQIRHYSDTAKYILKINSSTGKMNVILSNLEQKTYKLKFEELQNKIKRSEIERQDLENKLKKLITEKNENEKATLKTIRLKYQKVLEEDRRRQERNENLRRSLERIDQQAQLLASKTERLKTLKSQYETYLMRSWCSKNALHAPPSSVHVDPQVAAAPIYQLDVNQSSYSYLPANDYKSNVVKYLAQQRHSTNIYGYQMPYSQPVYLNSNIGSSPQKYYATSNVFPGAMQQTYSVPHYSTSYAGSSINNQYTAVHSHSNGQPIISSHVAPGTTNYQQFANSVLPEGTGSSLEPHLFNSLNNPGLTATSLDAFKLPSTPNIIINSPAEIPKAEQQIDAMKILMNSDIANKNSSNILSPLQEDLDYKTFGEKVDHSLLPVNSDLSELPLVNTSNDILIPQSEALESSHSFDKSQDNIEAYRSGSINIEKNIHEEIKNMSITESNIVLKPNLDSHMNHTSITSSPHRQPTQAQEIEYITNDSTKIQQEDYKSNDTPIEYTTTEIENTQIYLDDKPNARENLPQLSNPVYSDSDGTFLVDNYPDTATAPDTANAIQNLNTVDLEQEYAETPEETQNQQQTNYEHDNEPVESTVQELNYNNSYYDQNILQTNVNELYKQSEDLNQLHEENNQPPVPIEEQTAMEYSEPTNYETSQVIANPEYPQATATEYIVDSAYNNEQNQNYEPVNYAQTVQEPAQPEFIQNDNVTDSQQIYENQSPDYQQPQQEYYNQTYDELTANSNDYYQQDYNNPIEGESQQSVDDYQNYVTQSSEQYSNDPYYTTAEPGANYYTEEQYQQDVPTNYYPDTAQMQDDSQAYQSNVENSNLNPSDTYDDITNQPKYEVQTSLNPPEGDTYSTAVAPVPVSDSDFEFSSTTN